MPLFAHEGDSTADAPVAASAAGDAARPICIAILAMGGEGGGVLSDWIVDLGEHNGHVAQATSVAGVAQRTGATIYYVELFPRAESEREGAAPLLALMPAPGDVDVLIASELMEAARAVQRGLVTPDRTTLVASTHRVLSIDEKSAMGDGAVDSGVLEQACASAARRFVRFDMAEVVERSGSVISAVLFGALSGTGALPFTREQYERTIERGGLAVKASLAAFAEGYDRAAKPAAQRAPGSAPESTPGGAPESAPHAPRIAPLPETHADARVARLLQRLRSEFSGDVREMAVAGVRRTIDYQDPRYADVYLDRLARIAAHGDAELSKEFARHLALWMTYEDTIRVADLKTRSSRFARVRDEVRTEDGQLLEINEYMHPRLEEICDTLPAGLGRWLAGSGTPRRIVERYTRKGRVIPTTSLGGFLMLRTLASMRRWRRSTLRYVRENEAMERWLVRIDRTAATDPTLATEIARCQRLVKGYGDTHERGSRNFETLMAAVDRIAGRDDAAATLRALHEAALADDEGDALRRQLKAI